MRIVYFFSLTLIRTALVTTVSPCPATKRSVHEPDGYTKAIFILNLKVFLLFRITTFTGAPAYYPHM